MGLGAFVKLFTSLLLLLAWMPQVLSTAFCTCPWAGNKVVSSVCVEECCQDHGVEGVGVSCSVDALDQSFEGNALLAEIPFPSHNDPFALPCPLCGESPSIPVPPNHSGEGNIPHVKSLNGFACMLNGWLDYCQIPDQKTAPGSSRGHGHTKLFLIHHCLLR